MRHKIELTAAILTGILKIVCVELFDLKAAFIFTAIFGWLGYLGFRAYQNKSIFNDWGLTSKHFKSSFLASTIFACLAIIIMLIVAIQKGSLTFTWHFIPLLLLYPIWGLIQQLLVQNLVASNLKTLGAKNWLIVLASSSMFALAHVPYPILTLATFIMGIVFTIFYLKWRNIWALGLYHGILGVFLYFWVLNRNPWLEVFG